MVEKGTVEIVGGRYWQPATGQQSLDLNGSFEDVGTIYQDVPTQAGQKYRVRFAFAGNPDGGPTTKTFRVSWNGDQGTILSFETIGQSRTNMGWRYHEIIVLASGQTGRLHSQSLTTSFCGPTLDDVSVTPVAAEAATLAEEVCRTVVPASRPLPAPATESGVAVALAPDATNAVLQIQFCPVLTIYGSVGHTYRIECADDLAATTWTALTNLTLTSNPQCWADTQAGAALKALLSCRSSRPAVMAAPSKDFGAGSTDHHQLT